MVWCAYMGLNQWKALVFHTVLFILSFVQNLTQWVCKFSQYVPKFTPSLNEITQKGRKKLRKSIKFCFVFWKQYAIRKKILRPPVVTVATNFNSGHGWFLCLFVSLFVLEVDQRSSPHPRLRSDLGLSHSHHNHQLMWSLLAFAGPPLLLYISTWTDIGHLIVYLCTCGVTAATISS